MIHAILAAEQETLNPTSDEELLERWEADENQQALRQTTYDVYGMVLEELFHQYTKWGPQTHTPEKWNAITIEEYGETAKAMNEENWDEARKECIDMIACAVQWYQSLS